MKKVPGALAPILFVALLFAACDLVPPGDLPDDNPADPENPESCEVSFESNGGSAVESQWVAVGGRAAEPDPAPTKTGCGFSGWYGDESLGAEWDFENGVVDDDMTLYAGWAAVSFTVTLDARGGTGGTGQVTALHGAAMPAATAPVKAENLFRGYWSEVDGGGTQYYTAGMESARAWDIAENATLYAWWVTGVFTVTLDPDGGSGGTETVSAVYGSDMPTGAGVIAPTRTGYAFGGYWAGTGGTGIHYYDADMESLAAWDTEGDSTLYAQWTANIYTITFEKQGGTGGDGSAAVTYDAALPVVAPPDRDVDWYIFMGYFTEEKGGGIPYYDDDGEPVVAVWDTADDMTLYAFWNWVNKGLGDLGQAGGRIFYDNPDCVEDGWRYLEAAPADTEWVRINDTTNDIYEYYWGPHDYTYRNVLVEASGTDIGTGPANTAAIVEGYSSSPETPLYAAYLCDTLSVEYGGVTYDDWFLPSRDELYQMSLNLIPYATYGFCTSDVSYWSSSESSATQAYQMFFITTPGYQISDKWYNLSVRAARRF